MATGTTYSDREFLFRLQTLVIDGGTEVVRNIFDQKLQNQPLNVFLGKEKPNIITLQKQKIITKAQRDLLYPKRGPSPALSDFDITLIVCLLQNLPSLRCNQSYNWKVPPQAGDTSIEADVCRLRVFRNEIAHTSSTTGFQQSSFQSKWSEIETVLLRLDQNSPTPNFSQTIDSYKNSSMDPANEQRIRTMIEQWQERDRGLETDMRLIKKDVGDLKEDVKSTKEDLSNTNEGVKRIKKDFNDTKEDVKRIKKDFSDTKKGVKRFKKDFNDTNEGVKRIKKDFNDTKEDVKRIKKDFSDTKKGVKRFKKDFNDTKEDVKRIKKDFSDTKKGVKRFKKDFNDTKKGVKRIKKDFNDMMEDVKRIKKDFSDTKKDVQSTKKGLSDTQEDVKSITKGLSDTQDDVNSMKKDVKSIKKDVSELRQGMLSQEETEKGEEKAYVKMKSNLQDDLISFYKRQHKNIPLSPLMEESQPLLKFYEMPGIQSVKVTRSRDGDRPEKTPVTTLRGVFYKGNKLCSNIYLTADAGYGKTAFSKKLALAWCQAKQPNESEDEHFSDDEITVMSEFRFVFLVLLRDSSNECDLDKLILNQICSKLENDHKYSLENLKGILHEETCLVILDGLDEWTHPLSSCSQGESNIPHQKARENVAVLTTTRPWKLSVIGLHSSQIDQKLELEGLSNVSAKKLKRSVISHLHGEQEKNKIDKYEKEFNMTVQDSHKSDLTAIPLFLMYLLFLWYYKFKVGKSLADLYSSFTELLLSRTVNKDGIQIPKTETVQGNIPPCLDNNTLCKTFYTLLTTLGKLAFYTLCSETKENTLVFDGCIAKKYLREDKLRFCLETGIITQSKVQGTSLLQQKTKVSFAHKTMQEFLAALYINSAPDQKSVKERVLSKCKCVKDILDMSKLFIFIVSISGKFSFSRELMKIINEDEITQEYRSSLQDRYDFFLSHPLKDLQDMYILCCKEIPREIEVNICLQDVFIDESCEQEEYRENLKQLTTRNKQNIRSVYIDMFYMEYNTPYNTARKVIDYFSLSDLENIEKIHYTEGEYSDYILHLLNSSVKSLYLSCNWSSWSRPLFDEVRSLQKLEAIKISGFNMSHSELSLLLDFISQRDCLREIELEMLSCTDHEDSCTDDEDSCTDHEDSCTDHEDSCTDHEDSCTDHGNSCTGFSIVLTRHSSLRKLTLRELKPSQLIINMASLENCDLDLSNQDLMLKFQNCANNKLNTFYCSSLESSAAIDEMLRMLRESRHVRKVYLWHINLGRRSLPLSPDCVNIEDLKLHDVSMKAAKLEELVDFVLKLKQTVTVDINECTISPREEFETLKGKIKTLQRVTILR